MPKGSNQPNLECETFYRTAWRGEQGWGRGGGMRGIDINERRQETEQQNAKYGPCLDPYLNEPTVK